jgi:hypothetical protein
LASVQRKVNGILRAIEDGLYHPAMELIRSLIAKIELSPCCPAG